MSHTRWSSDIPECDPDMQRPESRESTLRRFSLPLSEPELRRCVAKPERAASKVRTDRQRESGEHFERCTGWSAGTNTQTHTQYSGTFLPELQVGTEKSREQKKKSSSVNIELEDRKTNGIQDVCLRLCNGHKRKTRHGKYTAQFLFVSVWEFHLTFFQHGCLSINTCSRTFKKESFNGV